MCPGKRLKELKLLFQYRYQDFVYRIVGWSHTLYCKPIVEEARAGNPQASFCEERALWGARLLDNRLSGIVYLFSLYLFGLGAILVLVPNVLLGMFGIPGTNEVWIRVVGTLVLVLGFYYFQASRNELIPFLRATVYGRAVVLFFFTGFSLFGLAPATLILFGAVDALAAFWTFTALRSENKWS